MVYCRICRSVERLTAVEYVCLKVKKAPSVDTADKNAVGLTVVTVPPAVTGVMVDAVSVVDAVGNVIEPSVDVPSEVGTTPEPVAEDATSSVISFSTAPLVLVTRVGIRILQVSVMVPAARC